MYNFSADRLFVALERGEPAPGMLLVSAPDIQNEDYTRSVILVVEHNEAITLGVNLTRRSEIAVFNVLPDWISAVAKPQALYIGGPMNQQAVVGLGMARQGVDIAATPFLKRLAPRLVHINLQAQPEEVAEAVDGMRLFAGYCEWAPGQLDEEIEAGDWYVVPALPGDVIMPGRADLWSDVMRRQPMPLPLFSTYPAHVEDN
ncbi:YqgE/AlgH family protein [Corynebacterium tapiri]|uniref:YqgE/AlgH family protein n=1 Tax=Corynebacterium tapiri TaxID=1448266 RepID=UPI0015D6516E|nr:YqgE/AlgH family protein [Corynebacterium tapiri]